MSAHKSYRKLSLLASLLIMVATFGCTSSTATPTLLASPTTHVQPTSTQPPHPTSTPKVISQYATFRGNAQHTGVYAKNGDYGEWAFFAGGPIASSPVLVGDSLYFSTMAGIFYALDPSTQQVRWQVSFPPGIFSSPAIFGGNLFFGGLDNKLHALDATTGQEKWNFTAGSPIISSPAVDGGTVYFGATDGIFYALDAANGKEKWRYQTSAEIISSAQVEDGLVLFASTDSFVYALDATNGAKKWMYLAESAIQATPAIADHVVYITSLSENLSAYAIDLQTGKALWKTNFGPAASSPVVLDGVVYAANLQGTVAAANTRDGAPLWTFQANSPVISSLGVSQDQVVFGDADGRIRALDRQKGKELWSYQTNGEIWSSPALAGNNLFIGSSDGYLYTLNNQGPQLALAPTATPLPLEPTPTMLPEPPAPSQVGTSGLPWWNDRIFYEVFVRSFKDSNGDGNGDLQGLIDKLDYLNDGDPSTTSDLGITGLWLMPVTESPSYHGYDVVDYRQIEHDYGSNADFQELVSEAHKRGIVVIVDMVMNHTSNQNPWFVQAAYPGTRYENWYIWSPTDPGYLSPWDSQVWQKSPPLTFESMRAYHALTDYYYGLFWSGMPDLNYRNGAVTAEMFDILRFWLEDMNVDGLRLDAVRHLIEDGPIQENTPETHAWLQNFDNYVHTLKPDALTVGEIWDDTAKVVPYIPDEVDIAFEFKFAESIIKAINTGDNTGLISQMNTVLSSYPDGQFGTFLTNHDITRLMTQLQGDPARAKLAAALLLTSPGVPFIYYGEEIGLMGTKPDDIDLRRPMQWDGSPTAGFTTGTPWVPPGKNLATVNVATEEDDPASLLNQYRLLIQLRQEHPALRTGETWLVNSSVAQIYSFLRQSNDENVLVVANLSAEAVSGYQLTLDSGPLQKNIIASLLMGEGQPKPLTSNPRGGFNSYTPLSEIPPYTTLVILLQ
jgi:alpha-amylase